jgi:CheY-like chemotaxis protein
MTENLNVSVLIIDDDESIRTLLSTLLKRMRAEVECVPDGRAALARLEARPYSVVLLDLMMPKVDGFEFLTQVSESRPALLKRIIVLTAASQHTLARLQHEAEVWRVIRKPFDISELIESVAECAAAQSGLQQAAG